MPQQANRNQGIHFQQHLVWNGWLRLSHWLLALSTLVLLATGALMANSPYLRETAMLYHFIAAAPFVFALLLRLLLLFVSSAPQDRLAALLPTASDLSAIKTLLRFYLSLGRAPLANWYAHNPLWKPFYLLLFMAAIVLALSGLLRMNQSELFSFYTLGWHRFWAQYVLFFCLLHVVAVCLHDYRGRRYDISAMLHGYRLFSLDREAAAKPVIQAIDIRDIHKH